MRRPVSTPVDALAVDLPFLHIVDPAARQVVAGGFQTVGLLGSRYTHDRQLLAGSTVAI
jgi:aspartate/glutamate racemase